MASITQEELEALLNKKAYRKSFENEHGEKFTIWVTDVNAYFKSSETDDEIVSLFGSDFTIFSTTELREIGKALVEATEGKE